MIFKLPLHCVLAMTFASSEHLFISIEMLGVLSFSCFHEIYFGGGGFFGSVHLFFFFFTDSQGWTSFLKHKQTELGLGLA